MGLYRIEVIDGFNFQIIPTTTKWFNFTIAPNEILGIVLGF